MKLELAFDGACEFKMPHVTQAGDANRNAEGVR
jgi:hypothetical protein